MAIKVSAVIQEKKSGIALENNKASCETFQIWSSRELEKSTCTNGMTD